MLDVNEQSRYWHCTPSGSPACLQFAPLQHSDSRLIRTCGRGPDDDFFHFERLDGAELRSRTSPPGLIDERVRDTAGHLGLPPSSGRRRPPLYM